MKKQISDFYFYAGILSILIIFLAGFSSSILRIIGLSSSMQSLGIKDFFIESISMSPETLNEGDLPTFSVTIRNAGGDSLDTIITSLKLDQENDGTFEWIPQTMYTGPLLSMYLESEKWSGWSAVSGMHKIETCTDVTNLVSESDETNNCSTFNFMVGIKEGQIIPEKTSSGAQIAPAQTTQQQTIQPEISPSSETSTKMPPIGPMNTFMPGFSLPSDQSEMAQNYLKMFDKMQKKQTAPNKTFETYPLIDNSEKKTKVQIPKKNISKLNSVKKLQSPGKKAGTFSTVNTSNAECSREINPVCGSDGKIYPNFCIAEKAGVKIVTNGICKAKTSKKTPVAEIEKYTKKSNTKKTSKTSKISLSDIKRKIKKSAKSTSSSSSVVDTNFALGPGIDREIFFVTTSGTGTFETTATWSGTASLLKLEVAPKKSIEKENSNTVGDIPRYVAFVGQNYDFSENYDDFQPGTDAEIVNQNPYVIITEGSTPLQSSTITLDTDHYKELQITVTSGDGEAVGSLSFGGTGTVLSSTKKDFISKQLTPVQKIIVPLVMYQLQRSFQNIPTSEKAPLDFAFDQNLATKPLASLKLKNALLRYNSIPMAKKQTIFNSQTITILDDLQGQALTPESIQSLSTILRSNLPPITPREATSAVTITDPDAQTAGKILTLLWLHDDPFEDGFSIERAPVYDTIEQQYIDPGVFDFSEWKKVDKTALGGSIFQELVSGDPDEYCYRISAFNKNGYSGYSNVTCPKLPEIQFQKTKYNLMWTKLKAIEESDVDGVSNSDEPYLIFSMVNGKDSEGKTKVWTRRWTGADDVDTGETEPDGGDGAHFTLLGSPPPEVNSHIKDLEDQLRQAVIQGNSSQLSQVVEELEEYQWGTINTNTPEAADFIDLETGLVTNITVMEHDDGASITLEEQIRAGIDAALDIGEALASPDPYHIAIAVESTLESLYTLWAADDYVGSMTWPLTYWEAWSVAPPSTQNAVEKAFTINGGSSGKYQVKFCLYPINVTTGNLANGCDIH